MLRQIRARLEASQKLWVKKTTGRVDFLVTCGVTISVLLQFDQNGRQPVALLPSWWQSNLVQFQSDIQRSIADKPLLRLGVCDNSGNTALASPELSAEFHRVGATERHPGQ